MVMARHHASVARALGPVRACLEAAMAAQPNRRVLVACSGGADSVALLGLAYRLRRGLGMDLVVGHVDHGLREAAAKEAALVRRLAATLGLPSEVSRLDLRPGAGLSARARAARRAALLAQADRLGASVVALGHTATDQVETMLLHLTRGAALDGIAAMPPVDGPWCRPLLDLTRAQTRELVRRLELPFVDDPTNDDARHARVALRQQVLPILARINPQFERAFGSASRRAAEADQALAQCSQQLLVEARCNPGHWSVAGLSRAPRAVRMRVLRDICRLAGADLECLPARVVESIDAAVVTQASARQRQDHSVGPKHWDLTPRIQIRVDKHGVFATASPAANH
ncbi:MAG: tRNA lysidine(34) synthetase TilS [Myxococcales bacterium FL481]|nr:MAG: tRNA lysidine(34) synthetase TilS [Myxococcales bacterium FL481]